MEQSMPCSLDRKTTRLIKRVTCHFVETRLVSCRVCIVVLSRDGSAIFPFEVCFLPCVKYVDLPSIKLLRRGKQSRNKIPC